MHVFLSWSKPRSHAASLAFYEWLPDVLQRVIPWMSSEDIASGSGWSQDIRVNLQLSNYGILFVTRENHDQPWLMFEAGALAKHVSDNAKVVPLIVDDDLKPEALTGPLSQFQARRCSKENVFRLVKDLNDECDESLSSERLRRCFDTNWKSLSKALKNLPVPEGEAPKLDNDAMLREILRTVRARHKPDLDDTKLRAQPTTGSGSGAGTAGVKRGLAHRIQERLDNARLDNLELNISELCSQYQIDEHDKTSIRNTLEGIRRDGAEHGEIEVVADGRLVSLRVYSNGKIEETG